MNGETLYEATPFYRPFPEPVDVFYDDIEGHSEFFLPVGILALNHLSSDWTGELPIVFPIEPVGGYGVPGEQSEAFHNYLCRPNWIGYYLRENRLQLACDFRFFHKALFAENPPQNEVRKREAAELDLHYQETRNQFGISANHFRQHGRLCATPNAYDPTADDIEAYRISLIRDLGGTSFHANWSSSNDFPMSRYPDRIEDRGTMYECDRVSPQTEDGRDFSYIGEVEMWNYIENTNGVLIVFYDPRERVVLTTIDWT